MMSEPLGTAVLDLYAGILDVVVLKGTILVAAAALVCRLSRRASASTRHAIWTATFAALLALPVLRPIGPPADLTVIGALARPSAPASLEMGAVEAPGVAPPRVALPAGRREAVAEPAAPRRALTTVSTPGPYLWIPAIWLLGTALQLVRLGAGVGAARRLRTRGRAGPRAIRARVARAAAELGLRRPPAVIVSPDIAIPSAFGVLRPTVALPTGIAGWPAEKLEAALYHEVSHLRRRDCLTHLLAGIAQAVYWINPAVWHACRRLDVERERACDDGVVHDRIDPVRYAEHLVSLAWSGRERATQPALSLASRSSLAERVRSLLDRAQARTPVGRAAGGMIAAIAVVAIVSAATVELFGVVQSPERQVAGLSDPDPLVRRHAAWALGEAEAAEHVPALIERLADPDPRVRVVSAWALGEIKDPAAIPHLAVLLRDDDPWVREMAVLAIGEIEDPAGLSTLRGAGPEVADPGPLAWAIGQIERGGRGPDVFAGSLAHPEARAAEVPRYMAELKDPRPHVRALAAERLGRLGAAPAVDALLDALDDPEPAVRAAAVWALDEINPTSDGPGPTG